MADHDNGIDEARAATITANIERAFGFVADVIDNPRILDLIPDGSSLAIREAWIGRLHLRLTAYRPTESSRWGARVTGIVDGRAGPGAERPTPPIDPEILAAVGDGADAGEAFANLEAELRAIGLGADAGRARRFG